MFITFVGIFEMKIETFVRIRLFVLIKCDINGYNLLYVYKLLYVFWISHARNG